MTGDRSEPSSAGAPERFTDTATERFADADTDRFTDWLRARAEPDWTAAVDHRFTHEVATGAVADAVFRRYLVQDYAFVGDLIGLLGHAVGEAPDSAAQSRLVEFLAVLTDDEDDYFRRSFDALDVPESARTAPDLASPTAAFVDLFGRAARVGGYAETLAVIVPAEWVYRSWATRAGTEGEPERFYLVEWIDLHANEGFCETVTWLREELDAVGPRLSPRREARVADLFCRTVTLERAFFDAAYDEARDRE